VMPREVVPDYKTWENQWVLFLSLVQTGVGKTELAKALAEYLFDDENADPYWHEWVPRTS
jgi:DNA polymerase III delta prime subunit